MQETYTYAGRGGRLSAKAIHLNNNNIYLFGQSFTWNALGELQQETYPRCTSSACSAVAPARTVAYTYSLGDLTGVTGWATLSYHDNRELAKVMHANGVTDWIDKDPAQMARPRNVRVTGPFSPVELGEYSYDGAGNLVRQRRLVGAGLSLDRGGRPRGSAA